MREYSTEVLDLMARVYERACDELSRLAAAWPDSIEIAKLSLVDGIVEAIDHGERNEEVLIAAALSKVDERQEGIGDDIVRL